MSTRADIVAAARAYLGTPFHHEGRVKGEGLDCVGLVIAVAHELNLSSFDIQGYARQPDPGMFRALLRAHMDEIGYPALRPGDVLSFAFIHEQHLAIVSTLEPLTIIHCWEKAGACAEHAVDGRWLARLRGCWRYRGVA